MALSYSLTVPKLGDISASSLVKNAATLTNELATFQDTEARLTYENSAKTSADLATYTNYLKGRINTLRSTGTVVDQTKALNMQQSIVSATHANISADISRENIQLMSSGMSGTAQGYMDKMNVVASEYSRALGINDAALAQTLESQYYSLSQSYQNAVASASSASATLGRAASASGATYQGEVYTNLSDGLKYLNGLATKGSQTDLNNALKKFVSDNQSTFEALGVKLPAGATPNYWDTVFGVAGAMYNAKALQAQAESAKNPVLARDYSMEAANLLSGQTKISTLAGSLTVQQVQEAQQNPQMMAYDNTTGKFKLTAQSGWQYMDLTNADGSTSKQLVPQYSGYASDAMRNKVMFLSPTQTIQMNKLGLSFTDNKNGTTGDGVLVQASNSTPQWLRNIMGNGGIANMYVSDNGFLQFKAGSTTGPGGAIYTLAADNRGLAGLYEQSPTGAYSLAGGDYGFNSGAMQLLLNRGGEQQHIAAVEAAQTQAKLQLAMQQQQARLKIPVISQPSPVSHPVSQAARLQPAAPPQFTANPQPRTYNPQPQTYNPQSSGGGFNLNQSGGGKGWTISL